jgi:toxin FitB
VSFLLDTNVVSEWLKPRPNPGVVSWLAEVDEDQTFLSVVTITELRYGIERLPASKRKKRLDEWLLHELLPRFEERILPVDLAIAEECGKLLAKNEAAGRPIEPRDAFIGATAEVYGLTLVTRNASDFQPAIKNLFMPWTPNGS